MDRRKVQKNSRIPMEILVVKGGWTERDSVNSRKASLKRVRHKVMAGTLQPNLERPYSLSFSLTDKYDVVKPHADLLVVIALVSSFRNWRMLVNIGSSVDVLFWDAFQRIGSARIDFAQWLRHL